MTTFAAMVGDEFGDRPGECERCEMRDTELWRDAGGIYEEWTCPDCDSEYVRRTGLTAFGYRRGPKVEGAEG